jgi:ABC-type Mn2+/Zn2+ transport system ATPase subunit
LVGYVPEAFPLNHHFLVKVSDFVSLGNNESGRGGWGFYKKIKKRSDQVLDDVNLSGFKKRSWQALSGGQR